MTTPTTESPAALSQRLRRVSFEGHTGDDSAPARYYTAYTRGGLDAEGVAAQAVQHYFIYRALENAATRWYMRLGDDFAFWLPELHRIPRLRDDLAFWLGDDFDSRIEISPRLRPYIERIETVAIEALPLFVAHHYTRYLADLSGGQQIGEMHRTAYGLQRGAGATFYEFDDIPDAAAYKVHYRELLDAAPFTEEEIVRIEDEVRRVYALNNAAAVDLEQGVDGWLA